MVSPSYHEVSGRSHPQQDASDDEFFCDTQLFDAYDKQSERFRKTLYYGELPKYSDRPSLALTSLALEFFTKSLPPRDELRFLDMEYASRVMRNACVTPTSVVVALMYADRLRKNNPHYMAQANSCDLFLISMLVASKFLYDDGVENEVYNVEWAEAANVELSQLNREERNFLQAIQWKLMVRPEEFDSVVADMEKRIAIKQLASRKDSTLTYTELDVLTQQSRSITALYIAMYNYGLKVISVSLVSYCACLLTVFASVATVNYVIPVLRASDQSKSSIASTNAVANVSLTTTSDSSPPYSSVLFDHQQELDMILREEFDNTENLTLCCFIYSDKINRSVVEERRVLEVKSSELLKLVKILTQFGILPLKFSQL